MFNDKFGLTQAVLDGRKTMTRRICKDQQWSKSDLLAFNYDRLTLMTPPNYLIGEVVAIAQCYYNVYGYETCISERGEKDSGIFNKMFVRAESMPHHIKITNIRVEHLQDISEEDCLREGIEQFSYTFGITKYARKPILTLFGSPREAFAALIDKVSGKGTWESNPLVWVYEFELVD